jgi:LysM domain
MTTMTSYDAQRRGRPVTGPVRLTRRGRWLLVLTVMTLLVIAGFSLGRGSSLAAGTGGSGAAPTRHTVVVARGETLWALAVRVAPHADPRLEVADIESLNHLRGPIVEAGQQLVVPGAG